MAQQLIEPDCLVEFGNIKVLGNMTLVNLSEQMNKVTSCA
jgi:hypothetical protein